MPTASGLPYPAGTSVVDVPADIKALADALEIHSRGGRVQRTNPTGPIAANGTYIATWETGSTTGDFGTHPVLTRDVNGVLIPFDGFYSLQLEADFQPSAVPSRASARILDNGANILGALVLVGLSLSNTNALQVAGVFWLAAGHKVSASFSAYGASSILSTATLMVVGPLI